LSGGRIGTQVCEQVVDNPSGPSTPSLRARPKWWTHRMFTMTAEKLSIDLVIGQGW